MADQSTARHKRSKESSVRKLLENPKVPFSLALILADSILVALIITYVPYTKIDWDAYMSQVSGFLGGERDYSKLEGDTGPLVYPAGFLYIYSAIQFLTGAQVYPAQILFGFLYIANLGIILLVYLKTEVVPWWALSLLCLSKRVHSIFILRLFNDCIAMILFHASLVSLLYQKWHLGLIVFSGAVSVKMNVLLYAPPLLLLMFKAMNIFGVVSALAGAAIVQILLGLPFIISNPISYISRAFNLGRVFIHFWSVNFKFVPEQIFTSKMFALSLLVAHLILLAVFAHYKWSKYEGGILSFIHTRMVQTKFKYAVSSSFPLKKVHRENLAFKALHSEHIVTTMFVGNFIGIVCARSLHYQFYSWYFYTLPYLLWKTPFPTFLRLVTLYQFFTHNVLFAYIIVDQHILDFNYSCMYILGILFHHLILRSLRSLILFAGVEFCWNVYPSNSYSSFLLLCIHLLILWGLWSASPESPYADDKSLTAKKRK